MVSVAEMYDWVSVTVQLVWDMSDIQLKSQVSVMSLNEVLRLPS